MPSEQDPGTIVIADYDPEWPRLFEQERRRILEAVREWVTDVEHVGSTSVPGLPAKPIVDIMIGLRKHEDGERCIAPLEAIGYQHRRSDIEGEYYFRKTTDTPVPGQYFSGVGWTVHVHMWEKAHPEWDAHILFRDFLRQQPAVAARYGELKRKLAEKYPHDRIAYMQGKTEFIKVVVGRARAGPPRRAEVIDYDPRWPAMFEEERARILEAAGDDVLDVQHVGSTAVPGLAAKPVIDIMLAVRDLDEARRRIVEPLAMLGYEYVPEYEAVMPYRLYFRKGNPRSHHVHMVQPETEFWERHQLFRDYLREHPEAAREYADLKKRLSEEHGTDMDGYTEAKSDFIRGIEAKARQAKEARNA